MFCTANLSAAVRPLLFLLCLLLLTAQNPAHAALHRMDFTVKGTSCAVCLMTIQRTLGKNPGVEKVAVMLKKPYGAVVVYESSKTNFDKMFKPILAKFKKVTITVVEDKAIDHVPVVLVPKTFTGLEQLKK